MNDNKHLFFIDTNILVYAYEGGNSLKKRASQRLLNDIFNGKKLLAVSNQIISEFISASVKKGKLNINLAKEIAKDILDFDRFVKLEYSSKTAISAAEISSKYNMPFWDSLIAATMLENNIFNIFTENAKDFKIPIINAINPFAERR
jgi:predicted nucleic acid-binding protein